MIRRMSRDRFLSDDELERFLAAVRERRHVNRDRDYALFTLVVNTGIRPSEALSLRACDVHLRGRRPWLRLSRAKLKHRPDPTNELELNVQLAAAIRAHADTVRGQDRLWPFSKRQAERLFLYYATKAGLSGFHLFSLRHTAGMRLYSGTRDVRLIQALMGHRRLKATNAYVHTSREDIRRALETTNA